MLEIKLGMKVKDLITGFEGIVDHIVTPLQGCPQALVQPQKLGKEGQRKESEMFDVTQLEIVDSKQIIEVAVPAPRFEFLQKVRDPITGYEGKIFARAVYLNGCVRIGVQPEHSSKREKFDVGMYFPEQLLEPVGKMLKPKADESKQTKTGGPAIKFADSRMSSKR